MLLDPKQLYGQEVYKKTSARKPQSGNTSAYIYSKRVFIYISVFTAAFMIAPCVNYYVMLFKHLEKNHFLI